MLEFKEMQSNLSLAFHKGLLWPGVVAPNRILSMGQKELVDI